MRWPRMWGIHKDSEKVWGHWVVILQEQYLISVVASVPNGMEYTNI